eukprot:TRINITY_DN58013_c0_g1_i1.p1 TRINITY_DN58013_c0_g1~~TRINITY_DN58013_c0_g1_i1.p1  ORF type:complete len:220 (+),score=20.82 TRINITY_DN58013_c0_g1_i1:70-729(+)
MDSAVQHEQLCVSKKTPVQNTCGYLRPAKSMQSRGNTGPSTMTSTPRSIEIHKCSGRQELSLRSVQQEAQEGHGATDPVDIQVTSLSMSSEADAAGSYCWDDGSDVRTQNLASIGSALHDFGKCKPCAWFWKSNGCLLGTFCDFCHECPDGTLAQRRKAKVQQIRQSEREGRRQFVASSTAGAHLASSAYRWPSKQVSTPSDAVKPFQGYAYPGPFPVR